MELQAIQAARLSIVLTIEHFFIIVCYHYAVPPLTQYIRKKLKYYIDKFYEYM